MTKEDIIGYAKTLSDAVCDNSFDEAKRLIELSYSLTEKNIKKA